MPPRPAVYLSRIGMKRYELSNHRGNLMTVISDKITPVDTTSDGLWDYFNPSLVSAKDYYPFGMGMPGRVTNYGYRYGMNAKENDAEIQLAGKVYDYGMRFYDSRLSRFLSVDPLSNSFPMLSCFQFGSNSPVANIDLDGLEAFYYLLIRKDGANSIKLVNVIQTRDVLGYRFQPGKCYTVYYNEKSYSFGNGNGLNTVGFKNSEDAFKSFINDPDNPRWLNDEMVNKLQGQIESLYGTFTVISGILESIKKPSADLKKPYTPDRKLKTDRKGNAIVDDEAKGTKHTQLGKDKMGKYTQRRTVDEKGKRIKDIDFHGRTDENNKPIPNPHQHNYDATGTRSRSHEFPTND